MSVELHKIKNNYIRDFELYNVTIGCSIVMCRVNGKWLFINFLLHLFCMYTVHGVGKHKQLRLIPIL